MKKIKIFLASSNELKPERDQFEIEIYRKCKKWIDKGVFLHLEIWEDLTARMVTGGLQSLYNKRIKETDLFVLLAYTKVGMYTAEEFNEAFGQFQSTSKPFIFTYFKETDGEIDSSLPDFKQKLSDLGHYYSNFKDNDDLWNQFNDELDRLELEKFEKFEHDKASNTANVTGDGNIVVQGVEGSQISINTGNTVTQKAEKIVNIDKADNVTI